MAKRKKKTQVKKQKTTSFVVIILFVLLALIVLSNFISKTSGPKKPTISGRQVIVEKKHSNISRAEAKDYFNNTIIPILAQARDSSEEIPFVRQCLRDVCESVNRPDKIFLTYSENYSGTTLASAMPKDRNSYIMFYVPRLMDWAHYSSASEFRDLVITTACHEIIHIRYDPIFGRKCDPSLKLKGEAIVWAIMLKEITRPLIAQGRCISFLQIEANKILKLCEDNPDNPRFVEFIKSNCF